MQGAVCHLQRVAGGLARNNKYMSGRLGKNVHEGEDVGILIHFDAWQIAPEDLGENIVRIVLTVEAHGFSSASDGIGNWVARSS